MNDDGREFKILRSGLTGRCYAGWVKPLDSHVQGQQTWVSVGKKHDVTDDVERLIREATR